MAGELVLDEGSRKLLIDELDNALDSLEVLNQLLDPATADGNEYRDRLRPLVELSPSELVDVAAHWRRRCLGMIERARRSADDFEGKLKEALDLSPEQSEKLIDWLKSQVEGSEGPKH